MNIRVEDIVDGFQRYHVSLADYYFGLKDRNYDTRVIDLLDYIGRCEQYQVQNIMSLRQTVSRDILKSMLTLPDYPLSRIIYGMNIEEQEKRPDNYEEVLRKALQGDVILKKACKVLSENVTDPKLKALFSNICKEADREISNLYTYHNLFAS